MNDFPFVNGLSNPGGLQLVEYTSIAAVATFPSVNDGVITTAPTFVAGQRWYSVYGSMSKKGFDEGEEETANGMIWEPEVNIFYPYDHQSVRSLVARMNFHQFILRLTDQNGFRRLVGTPWQGLTFSYQFSTGQNMGGTRGYALRWKGLLTAIPPTYTGA